MKSEQAAFGERLRAALRREGLSDSPAELVKLLARYDSVPVSPQAISGWLNGKSLPRQANLRALARLLRMEPHELQFGAADRKVREGRADWRAAAAPRSALDQHAMEAFLALPATQRKLVRELIEELAQAGKRKS
jgi:transcriptional regulator with XRE-family HTH domain